jgi:hypothetical protein
MTMIKRLASLTAAGAIAAASLTTASDASACGGCFVPPSDSTVVTGHRMALSVSPSQTILWDQIQYAGDPADFSWVLPVKPGARVELSNDAWFETLEAATQTTVGAPPEGCAPQGGGSGFGCGASDFSEASALGGAPNENGVTVVHQGTVGPYETVTLKAEDPNALNAWLNDNGYSVPADIQPTVDAYVNEGFDFVALRLQPGKGVAQMKPVRVVTPGGGFALPLRMVAAGVSAEVGVVLYVIGEGRYHTANFENAQIPPSLVTWDFLSDETDYSELRLRTLESNAGRTFLTTYSKKSLLAPVVDNIGFGGTLFYNVGNSSNVGFGASAADTIAEAYLLQGDANGESDGLVNDCIAALNQHTGSSKIVVEPCDDGGNCRALDSTEIDAADFRCGGLDDVASALIGMHPDDVVITRLEANLPRTALDTDLLLEAADDQDDVEHRFVAGLKANACWDSEPAGAMPLTTGDQRQPPLKPRDLMALSFAGLGLLLAQRRRRAAARRQAAG